MTTAAILNAILALGVLVMVVTPLVWAILTQHRDHPKAAAADGTAVRPSPTPDRRRAPRSQYMPVARGA